jgi:hypothetical protein
MTLPCGPVPTFVPIGQAVVPVIKRVSRHGVRHLTHAGRRAWHANATHVGTWLATGCHVSRTILAAMLVATIAPTAQRGDAITPATSIEQPDQSAPSTPGIPTVMVPAIPSGASSLPGAETGSSILTIAPEASATDGSAVTDPALLVISTGVERAKILAQAIQPGVFTPKFEVASVPEPTSIAILAFGLGSLLLIRRLRPSGNPVNLSDDGAIRGAHRGDALGSWHGAAKRKPKPKPAG